MVNIRVIAAKGVQSLDQKTECRPKILYLWSRKGTSLPVQCRTLLMAFEQSTLRYARIHLILSLCLPESLVLYNNHCELKGVAVPSSVL